VDRAVIAEALREAAEIVDEVLPRELPGVPRRPLAADRAELRRAALPAVLAALLAPGGTTTGMARAPEAARILGITVGTLNQWEKAGRLTPAREGAGWRYYDRGKLGELARGTRRPDHVAAEVVRLRNEGLTWAAVAEKTGLTVATACRRYRKWADWELRAGDDG
jgi:MerR HTH family regulatory protein